MERGDRIGPWIIEDRLGGGGSATTYRAHREGEDRRVALKCFEISKAESWKAFELFEREAETLRSLDNPAIPRFIDAFVHEDTRFHIVQELVEAPSLRDLIERGHRWSRDQLIDVARQVLALLEWLHDLAPPVVHRDIKPSNLLRADEGRVYLIDFGAVQQRLNLRPEGGSTVVGTHGYMAPEQLMGRATPASDLYGLGTTLVHLASGHHPADLPARGLELDFEAVVNLPDPLKAWLRTMCAADPTQRFESAARARAALDEALTPPAPLPVPAAEVRPARAAPEPRRTPVVLLAAASGAMVVVSAVLVLAVGSPDNEQTAADVTNSPPAAAPRPVARHSDVFVELSAEVAEHPNVGFEVRKIIHRRAESGFPQAFLHVAGIVENRGTEALRKVKARLVLRAFGRQTNLRWTPIDMPHVPLEPGERRYLTAQFHDVPNRIERVELSFDTEVLDAVPESGRMPFELAESSRLPSGVSLDLGLRRMWPPEFFENLRDANSRRIAVGYDQRMLFDTDLRINGMEHLDWLELTPTCTDGAGQDRPPNNDRVFQIIPQLLGHRAAKDGDLFAFRVLCPAGSVLVTWAVSKVQPERR